MKGGFHNHELEFKPIEGKRPMEVLAENTPKDLMPQLDVGTCIEAGSDPVGMDQGESRPDQFHALQGMVEGERLPRTLR